MEELYFPDINRAAVIVMLKKPFIDWLVYTSKEFDGDDLPVKAEEIETTGFDSKHVYLIPAFDKNEDYDGFLKNCYLDIFEHELNGWYTNPGMWPKDRSYKVFHAWLDVEIHTMVYDVVGDESIEYEG